MAGLKTRTKVSVVAVVLAAAIFVLDLFLPLGVAGGVPYVLVVLVSLESPRHRDTLVAAIACSGLTTIAFFFSPAGGVLWKVLFNRALALFAIWVTTIIGLQRKRAEEDTQRLNQELEQRVIERTVEIRKLNTELEQRVVERTAELAATIKELEAFTYSVSHDLRAPLRHIDGFSQILLEDFGPGLDSSAQHYLQRIRKGTRRMGILVDDLLSLSRVGRQKLMPQVTGLNSLVEEVRKDLQSGLEDRQIEWQIGSLPFLECDPALMKQVFANLLSNAVKYTRPREQALIQVDQMMVDGHPVVFVRDNGVGFSMKYADKLFGVFQRLHRAEDFEGTGVGLATAQRIIHNHGGRIWAEAELDKGATFYFTLGTLEKDEPENGITKAERS